ncbi:MAG: DnaJ domain-containing protein, partial [Actinomycetia bacterium]|nr:DnaJ domain-containing protein [Actinomycetes bacterium]
MPEEDYYAVLQVDPGAAPELIRKAFKILAAEYHPDKCPSSKKKWAEARFRAIREAYEVLSDPVSRSEYDLFIRTRAGEASARGRDIEYEREAFHHLRCGLQYYERSTG